MTTVPVPAWNIHGLIPPIDDDKPASPERSPYVVSLVEFVQRFGTSPERNDVLKGFLDYRAVLHAAGLVQGFQWLDGSFLENVEVLEKRPPRDIDVVTFYRLLAGQTQETVYAANPDAFASNRQLKADYSVDAYTVDLHATPAESLVRSAAYWYSMWSHRRTQVWKGYVQVDLSASDDVLARQSLAALMNQGGLP